jgi:hypothetical protein
MWTDAAANGGFAIILVMVAMFAGHHWQHRGHEAPLPAEA